MDELIEFRGMRVKAEWPDLLRQAQLEPVVWPNGVETPRVPYGDEADDWGADRGPCRDCAAVKGEFHGPGCDVERCPACGGQLYACDCDWPDMEDGE